MEPPPPRLQLHPRAISEGGLTLAARLQQSQMIRHENSKHALDGKGGAEFESKAIFQGSAISLQNSPALFCGVSTRNLGLDDDDDATMQGGQPLHDEEQEEGEVKQGHDKKKQQQHDNRVLLPHGPLLVESLGAWVGKMGNAPDARPMPLPSWWHSTYSLLQSFCTIGLLVYLDKLVSVEPLDSMFMVGSFGAGAVLMYSAIGAPLTQPRNVLYGHIVSAITGVSVRMAAGLPSSSSWGSDWWAAGLAVSLSIFVMERLNCVHPPGGATALYAVIGGPRVWRQGYYFVLMPCTVGPLLMLAVALVFNNLDADRKYPVLWHFPAFEWVARNVAALLKNRSLRA